MPWLGTPSSGAHRIPIDSPAATRISDITRMGQSAGARASACSPTTRSPRSRHRQGADLGTEDGRLLLDFNFAYNPSYAYNPAWSCPLAPPESRLPVAVAAGERAYAG